MGWYLGACKDGFYGGTSSEKTVWDHVSNMQETSHLPDQGKIVAEYQRRCRNCFRMRKDACSQFAWTDDTEFHEIYFITECNSHVDLLMITHDRDNVMMEHSHVLNLFKLTLRILNVSNRVNAPKCSHESAQWKYLLQPGDKRQPRHRFKGNFHQNSDLIQPGGVDIQFQSHDFSNKFLNFLLQVSHVTFCWVSFIVSWRLPRFSVC